MHSCDNHQCAVTSSVALVRFQLSRVAHCSSMIMASSDEILCSGEDECLRPRRRPQHGAQTEGGIFVVGVLAVQTSLTPPGYAGVVARLLVYVGPAPSLPGRLCVVGALAVQWLSVERIVVWSWWPSTLLGGTRRVELTTKEVVGRWRVVSEPGSRLLVLVCSHAVPSFVCVCPVAHCSLLARLVKQLSVCWFCRRA